MTVTNMPIDNIDTYRYAAPDGRLYISQTHPLTPDQQAEYGVEETALSYNEWTGDPFTRAAEAVDAAVKAVSTDA